MIVFLMLKNYNKSMFHLKPFKAYLSHIRQSLYKSSTHTKRTDKQSLKPSISPIYVVVSLFMQKKKARAKMPLLLLVNFAIYLFLHFFISFSLFFCKTFVTRLQTIHFGNNIAQFIFCCFTIIYIVTTIFACFPCYTV